MQRYLVRVKPRSESPEAFVRAARSIAKGLGADLRAPKTTSYGAVEFDVFVPAHADLELFLAALEPLSDAEFVHDLNVAPPHQTREQMVAEAVSLFNAERFWEAHEVLESLWRDSSGQEKLLLQGIILVCAAFVHSQKGKPEVALGVMRRAARQLEWPGRAYHGIDVQRLDSEVRRTLSTGELKVFRI